MSVPGLAWVSPLQTAKPAPARTSPYAGRYEAKILRDVSARFSVILGGAFIAAATDDPYRVTTRPQTTGTTLYERAKSCAAISLLSSWRGRRHPPAPADVMLLKQGALARSFDSHIPEDVPTKVPRKGMLNTNNAAQFECFDWLR
jgi:hypothetical protein